VRESADADGGAVVPHLPPRYPADQQGVSVVERPGIIALNRCPYTSLCSASLLPSWEGVRDG
jgi:hypothetical protein